MPRPQRASAAERERVIDLLRLRCAEGYLSPGTLSRRVESSLRARTTSQLEALVGDLPRRAGEHARTAWRRATTAMAAACLPPVTDAGFLSVSAREVDRLGGRLLLGRSASSDLFFSDASISRRHAELRHSGGRWWIEGRGLLNGVCVNGRPTAVAEIEPGDRLGLGDLDLTFEPAD